MFSTKILRGCLLVGTACLFLVSPAWATTVHLYPDGSGEFPDIQAAVIALNDGDEIVLMPGTYTGVGNTDVGFYGKDLTIRSQSGQPDGAVIDCQGSAADPHRGFLIMGGQGPSAVLAGLTIINGHGSTNNSSIYSAGALLIKNGSSPTIRDCVFENNHAGTGWDHAGGAVYVDQSCSPLFQDCEFTGNSAYWGGAVGVNHYSQAEFIGCRFIDNTAFHRGGAIWGNSTTKTGCLLAGNTADEGGAVWGNGYNEELSINCTYSGNSAPLGGAIYSQAGYYDPVTLIDSIIAGSLQGEAIWASDGVPVQLSCSDLYGNEGGDWIGSFAGQVDLDGNFSANPCFCSPETGDFTLCANSYCLPGHHPWGCDQLVGAYGEGCGDCSCSGPVATDRSSWGTVKTFYR
jgi:predicted outer membrane repeat protein